MKNDSEYDSGYTEHEEREILIRLGFILLVLTVIGGFAAAILAHI